MLKVRASVAAIIFFIILSALLLIPVMLHLRFLLLHYRLLLYLHFYLLMPLTKKS